MHQNLKMNFGTKSRQEMRIDQVISDFEESKAKPFIRVIVETDGTATGDGQEFQTEKEMEEYFENKPVNLIIREIVDPEVNK